MAKHLTHGEQRDQRAQLLCALAERGGAAPCPACTEGKIPCKRCNGKGETECCCCDQMRDCTACEGQGSSVCAACRGVGLVADDEVRLVFVPDEHTLEFAFPPGGHRPRRLGRRRRRRSA